MEYVECAPPTALRGMVRCLWALRVTASGSPVQTLVPDGRTEIVVHLGEPFSEVGSDGSVTLQARALVAGQLTGPLLIQPAVGGEALGIRFHTAGAASVFRGVLPDLTNRVLPLRDVMPALEQRFFDALRRAQTLEERLAHLGATLGSVVRRPVDQALHHAVRALECHGGSAGRIQAVARDQGVSVRTLERRVHVGTGLSPSTLAQVMRFSRVFVSLDRTPVGRWGRVAQDAGYFDQAHMIREFRRFAGAAPTHFFQCDPALARAFASDEA